METLDQFRDVDAWQVKVIQDALVDATMPFRAKIDPVLGAIAMARVLRALLRAASPKAQRELTPVLIAYIRGDVRPPAGAERSMLWTPGS